MRDNYTFYITKRAKDNYEVQIRTDHAFRKREYEEMYPEQTCSGTMGCFGWSALSLCFDQLVALTKNSRDMKLKYRENSRVKRYIPIKSCEDIK